MKVFMRFEYLIDQRAQKWDSCKKKNISKVNQASAHIQCSDSQGIVIHDMCQLDEQIRYELTKIMFLQL